MSISVKRGGDWVQCAGNGTLYADAPLGSILAYGGAVAPSGWMICDGTELVKTSYPELYAVIGDNFGTASDNTKFCLPDLREATTKGAGLTGKSNNHYDADGVALGEFVDDRIQRHAHIYNLATGSGTTWIAAQKEANIIQEITTGPVAEYGTGDTIRKGVTTEVKSVGVNYIIKAKMVAMPSDFMSKVDEAVSEVFDSGLAHLSAIQPNTKSEQTILFNKTFSTPPIVVCNLYGTYYSDELSLSAVLDVTTTDFKVRVTNTYAQGALAPYVSWLAKG